MKKIEAWKTTDGKIWESEETAEIHQKRKEAVDLLKSVYYQGVIECSTDLVDFLDQYRTTILKFYGVEEK